MLHAEDEAVAAARDWPSRIAALRDGFRNGAESPPRPHYIVEVPGERDATLLLMPAWTSGGYIGLKTVAVFPDNGLRAMPAVSPHYLLMSARDGCVVASLAAGELTSRRTAAASALASTYLSQFDARLLVVGAGFDRNRHLLTAARTAALPRPKVSGLTPTPGAGTRRRR